MVRRGVCLAASASVAIAVTRAAAAPPPAPPPEVFNVAQILIGDDDAASRGQLALHVAPDVKVYLNGKLLADGKPSWTRYAAGAAPRRGGALAYSYGWEPNGISLMVADEYDTVDRATVPSNMMVDPRTDTRTTRYEFGRDRLIHVIRIVSGAGFWIIPKR